MADDEKFERDIEGVFEGRAREFSPELRALLKEFWLEGVRQGRHLERLETHQLEADLARAGGLGRPAAAGADLARGPDITVVSQARIDPGSKLTPEDVARAVQALGPRPAPELLRRDPRWQQFRETQLESARDHDIWGTSGTLRQELMGSWSGTGGEACPSNSPKPNSTNSPRSSTPASFMSFGTGSGRRGTSGSS